MLFSVTIYLSIYLCLSADFRCCKRLQRPSDLLPTGPYIILRVYAIYFTAHCASVTKMSPKYNLLLRYEGIVDIGVMRSNSLLGRTHVLQLQGMNMCGRLH